MAVTWVLEIFFKSLHRISRLGWGGGCWLLQPKKTTFRVERVARGERKSRARSRGGVLVEEAGQSECRKNQFQV